MTAERLKKVLDENSYCRCLVTSRSDLEYIIHMVADLVEAEVESLKETEPYATTTIARLHSVAYDVRDLAYIVDDMDTDDLVKAKVWKN